MPKRSEPSVPTLPLEPPHLEPSVAPLSGPGAAQASAPAADDDTVARFEQDLQELEDIVTQMERGDLRLEDSLRLFERGTVLARACRRSLDSAELKVRRLLEADGTEPSP